MTYEITKSDDEWRSELPADSFAILRQAATEPAWTGALLDEKRDGVYRCLACKNELFLAGTKFESGSGWPSFYAPIEKQNVAEKSDNTFFMRRTEVLCARCDAHLGHVFPDGPKPTGLRYCMNGMSLKLEKPE
jgi:peptide-methionine (R)-S-oxide reductase